MQQLRSNIRFTSGIKKNIKFDDGSCLAFLTGTRQVSRIRTLYKRIGYVTIPKPHFSSREGISSRCRRFDLLLSAVLAQSVAAMIAVVASLSHVATGDRSTVTGVTPLFDGALACSLSSR